MFGSTEKQNFDEVHLDEGQQTDRVFLPQRDTVILTERLLKEIQRSINRFNPSKSLKSLSDLVTDAEMGEEPIAEIDVVISGGGLKGYFTTGCMNILSAELKRRNIRMARFAGASAGKSVCF